MKAIRFIGNTLEAAANILAVLVAAAMAGLLIAGLVIEEQWRKR